MTASWSLGQGSSTVELLGMPEAQGWLFPVISARRDQGGAQVSLPGYSSSKEAHH